jgi:TM2 domain-containing membrane protein YozV
MSTNKYGVVQKKWLTAFILSLFLGVIGADRFYLGKSGTAVLKLVTFGGLGIWALIDFIMIATKSMSGVEWVKEGKDDKRTAWIVFAIAVVLSVIISSTSANRGTSIKLDSGTNPPAITTDNSNSNNEPAKQEPSVPVEYKSALSQADTYANTMHLSKQGLYDQLVSQYGGKFTAEAAQYAIDNVKADWNANALDQAKTYQNDMHLSPAAVRDQLVSQYGGKFTEAEADYAIQNLNK